MGHSNRISSKLATQLTDLILEVPNFPRVGVSFKDIAPLLNSASGLSATVLALCAPHLQAPPDVIVGIEARGFIFGALMALELGCGLVQARKAGKSPGLCERVSYELEYGVDALEMQKGLIQPDQGVLIVDDVLATGGTAQAALQLVLRMGARPLGFSFLLELEAQTGRRRLAPHSVDSLLQY